MGKIINGEVGEFYQWHDDEGNIINASDGGVIYVDGVYYWYGQKMRPMSVKDVAKGAAATVDGVVMYSSKDLVNWHNEGIILKCSDNPESILYAPLRFERPKIIYNDRTKKFVLWTHYVKYPGVHGSSDGTGEAGVAVCDTVNGDYKFLGTCRPVDEAGMVRDCTLYKDIDKTAYLFYDRHIVESDNRCQYAVKLSDDYLSCTDTYKRIDAAQRREAPAISFHNGYYYMINSGLTGWNCNQAEYCRAKSILGEWERMGDPCTDDINKTTYFSQSTNTFHVEGTDIDILMLERHNTDNFALCSYVWLPIVYHDDNTISITYKKEWEINL